MGRIVKEAFGPTNVFGEPRTPSPGWSQEIPGGSLMGTIRTEAQLCEEAIQVQDASNASGVLGSWKRVADALWAIASERKLGTDFVNQHPAMALFADKLAQLTGIQNDHTRLLHAYDECYRLAGREKS